MTAPVPPGKRFLAALLALKRSAEELHLDEAPGPRWADHRAWALRLARRSLAQLGGVGGLTPDERAQADALGREISDLDRSAEGRLRDRLQRLRHAGAERDARRGRSLPGLLTDAHG